MYKLFIKDEMSQEEREAKFKETLEKLFNGTLRETWAELFKKEEQST